MKKSLIIIGLAALSLSACKPNLQTTNPIANGLDFTRYVAVGNSLTAGYANNSLCKSSQMNSFPAILASQFQVFGPIDFRQPLLNGEAGYPSPKLVLGYSTDCMGATSLSPMPYSGAMDTAGDWHTSVTGPYNNIGIPGIRAIDYLQAGYAYFNPYAARFFSSALEAPIEEAMKIDPTFFTMWLGNNDVLGYATSGGEGSTTAISPDNISDVNTFKASYDSVVKVMTRSGAKGVLCNIPDVTTIPFFTTVPYNGLVLTKDQAANLTAAYSAANITFTEGANNFIIQDPNVSLGFRQIKNDELILLTIPQDSLKCGGWGSLKPIPKKYVLSEDEIANIKNATTAFNDYIQTEAINYHLAFADMNAYLRTVSSGITYNGVNFNAQFISGGAFSLDGVHLTPRGYALVANHIIDVINGYYGSTIPRADISKYNGLFIP